LGRIEKSIEIKAPPGKVWEMLAFDRMPEWVDDLKSTEYTSEVHTPQDKYRVGASAHITCKRGPPKEQDDEITESLENEKITYHLKKSGTNQLMAIRTYILEPVEEGTKFTYVYEYEMPWGIFGKFIESLLKGIVERHFEKSLENLKSILEK